MATSKEQKDKLRPNWREHCVNCDELPTVPESGLCGPCHFGEADTVFGDWWDDKLDDLKGE